MNQDESNAAFEQAVQEIEQELSPHELIDALCAGLRSSQEFLFKQYENCMIMVMEWPMIVEKYQAEYAAALGMQVADLEETQKRQAWLNYIIKRAEEGK